MSIKEIEAAALKPLANRGPVPKMGLMPQTCVPVNPSRSTKPVSLEMEPVMSWKKAMKGKTQFKSETFKTAHRVSSQIPTSIPAVSPFQKTFSTTDKTLSTPSKILLAVQKTFCTADMILSTVDKVFCAVEKILVAVDIIFFTVEIIFCTAQKTIDAVEIISPIREYVH
jgi:hypothetical protein